MKKYHICGINLSSVNTYKYLKKKKFEITISDIKDKDEIDKKFLDQINKKDIYFGSHPFNKLNQADKIIISSGFISKVKQYKKYIKNTKYISELDLFYELRNWKKKSILLVTGSKGKTTLCKKIFKILPKKKYFDKIYYIDRKKNTYFNIPEPKKKSFLIIEIDYQNLLITKNLKAMYRISTSFSYTQNKAFETKKLYLTAKKKILSNLKKGDITVLDNSSNVNFKPKNKLLVNIKKCDIKKKNNE